MALRAHVRRDLQQLSIAVLRPADPERWAEAGAVDSAARRRIALGNDGFKVLVLTRLREAARRRHIPGVNHALRLVTTVLFSVEVGNEVVLGDGVNFTHTLGTVVGGTSRLGARVTLMGNNTIGTAKDNGCPVIGDDVVIGAGARILGPLTVGDGAVIGANAVVLDDVPAGAVVAGIPARIVRVSAASS